jgi:hypothetical protein
VRGRAATTTLTPTLSRDRERELGRVGAGADALGALERGAVAAAGVLAAALEVADRRGQVALAVAGLRQLARGPAVGGGLVAVCIAI